MKIQRLSAITMNERTVSGLQLTRVVPPSFSVPFTGSAGGLAFFMSPKCALRKMLGGARASQKCITGKGEEKHGKRKISQKNHTS